MFTLESVLQLVAPFDCLVCYREGSLLCADCRTTSIQPFPSHCYRCFESTAGGLVCQACKPHTPVLQAWVATEHGAAARELVRALKFARARSAARVAATLMHQLLPPFPPGAVLVPIPTATTRVRERGYDQAELITRHLAKLRGLSYKRLLRRHGATRQVGASRTQRQAQLAAAFSMRVSALPSAPLILIDDVTTTGATIEAAARELKANGAHTVNAALFAQKSKDLPI